MNLTARIGLAALLATTMACSADDGAKGEKGDPGAAGSTGPAGPSGSDGPAGPTGPIGPSASLGYAGSQTCGGCHAEELAAWENSGHPYKIVPVADIMAGDAYPAWVQDLRGEDFAVDADFWGDVPGTLLTVDADTFPNGWDDVAYVIGGYGWKARFIGNDGYIITGTDNGTPGDTSDDDRVQYNPPLDVDAFGVFAYEDVAASAATYHTGEQKPYNCGACHTTGWIPDVDHDTDNDLSDNQDERPGIHGTWVEPGVGCEGCHGPSVAHSETPRLAPTAWDAEASCANCHIRADPYELDTSGGFIRHHEQFEEIIQGKHTALGCGGCHQAHNPVRYRDEYVALEGEANDPNPDFSNISGIRVECESCHFAETAAYADWATGNLAPMATLSCESCHMPKATKSAVRAGDFYGDTATHLFGINAWVDPVTDPTLSTTGANPANSYISLDYACGPCHTDVVTGMDVMNPDFHLWATTATGANGGIHGR